jgi:hypothetical protein
MFWQIESVEKYPGISLLDGVGAGKPAPTKVKK